MSARGSSAIVNLEGTIAELVPRVLRCANARLGEQEVRPNAAWRMTIGPLPGDTQTPGIAIMVGPKTMKKTVAER